MNKETNKKFPMSPTANPSPCSMFHVPCSMKSGFTLIEILVVIAIIGILSSVVLVSLNEVKVKAKVANVKANMANLRPAMEIYRDTSSDYGEITNGVCTTAGGAFNTNNGPEIIAGINTYATPATASCSGDVPNVGDVDMAWAIWALLPDASGNYHCIDSTGATLTSVIAADTDGDGDCGA